MDICIIKGQSGYFGNTVYYRLIIGAEVEIQKKKIDPSQND